MLSEGHIVRFLPQGIQLGPILKQLPLIHRGAGCLQLALGIEHIGIAQGGPTGGIHHQLPRAQFLLEGSELVGHNPRLNNRTSPCSLKGINVIIPALRIQAQGPDQRLLAAGQITPGCSAPQVTLEGGVNHSPRRIIPVENTNAQFLCGFGEQLITDLSILRSCHLGSVQGSALQDLFQGRYRPRPLRQAVPELLSHGQPGQPLLIQGSGVTHVDAGKTEQQDGQKHPNQG